MVQDFEEQLFFYFHKKNENYYTKLLKELLSYFNKTNTEIRKSKLISRLEQTSSEISQIGNEKRKMRTLCCG